MIQSVEYASRLISESGQEGKELTKAPLLSKSYPLVNDDDDG